MGVWYEFWPTQIQPVAPLPFSLKKVREMAKSEDCDYEGSCEQTLIVPFSPDLLK